MASEAAAHARKLIAGRELKLFDAPVALGATDVSVAVFFVGEYEVGGWEARGDHSIRFFVSNMAIGTRAAGVFTRAHICEIRVVAPVALVARHS